MRRHASDDVVEDVVIAGGGVFWLALVSGFLIEEIYIGTGVSIFSQRGFSIVFSACIVCLSNTEIPIFYLKQMRAFFLLCFFFCLYISLVLVLCQFW